MNKSKKKDTKQLVVSQNKKLKEWEDKMKNDNEALKEGKEFTKYLTPNFDPDQNLIKLAREIIPKINIKKVKLIEEEDKLLQSAFYDQGLESGISMMDSVEERYRGMIFNLRRELVKEYDCKTYSEKALVDMIVGAYARNLSISKILINTATAGTTTPNLNGFMSVMSKEVDRASRHFVTALEALRQIKQPELKINVKTKNAYIAQNQQINANQNKPNEIIDPN